MQLKVFTEIALALAMACCSLLVLMMLSYGVGCQAPAVAGGIDAVAVASTAVAKSATAADTTRNITIYYQGGFYDTALQPLQQAQLTAAENGMDPALAVDPALSFAKILQIQSRFSGWKPQILALTPEWQAALRTRFGSPSFGQRESRP